MRERVWVNAEGEVIAIDAHGGTWGGSERHMEMQAERIRELEAEVKRLTDECARCESCGHVQAEPNWCHRCGHRTSIPAWAKPLLDAHQENQRLRGEG